MKRVSLTVVTAVLFAIESLGYEVDNFTRRYEPLADARVELNKEVNRLLGEAVKRLNGQMMPVCVDELAYQVAGGFLNGWIVGNLEAYATESPAIQKHKPTREHIYSQRDLKSKIKGFMMTTAGLNVSINVNGHYIGADKLGHFFDQGAEYLVESLRGGGEGAALQLGFLMEEKDFGLSSTGVKSYADLAANYGGFRFWKNLVGGDNPYFKCHGGKWTQVRQFDWADYVTDAWDEAINCSDYSPGTAKAVTAHIEKLEAGNKGAYTCPISAAVCANLAKHYGAVAKYVLHPKCLNAKPTANDLKIISGQRKGASSRMNGVAPSSKNTNSTSRSAQ